MSNCRHIVPINLPTRSIPHTPRKFLVELPQNHLFPSMSFAVRGAKATLLHVWELELDFQRVCPFVGKGVQRLVSNSGVGLGRE
jgi:hypothetical protein